MTIRISAIILLTLLINSIAFAQEEATEEITETPKERPVRAAFESGLLFDAATTTLQPSKTMEMVIQHRFGYIDSKDKKYDFFGIWGGSNIRVAMNYSILDNLTVGFGTTKYNKMQDLQIKYRVIEQTRSNSIPITVMLYEVIGQDGSPKTKWDATPDSIADKSYKFSNRMSYFTQVVVSRRFNDQLSLQVAGAFTHYNSVDSLYDHDRISVSFAGRYKFSPQASIIVSGDFPLKIEGIRDYKRVDLTNKATVYNRPNICLGLEISTSTHAFQIYMATAQGILPQEGIMWNSNYTPESVWNKDNLFKGNVLIGLNITRLWNF